MRKTLRPRAAANHTQAVDVLAFLALDRPEFAGVLRSLVIDLYGVRALDAFASIAQQFAPAPSVDAVDPSAQRPRTLTTREKVVS